MKKLLFIIIAGTSFITLTSCEQNELAPRPSGSVENIEYARPQSLIDEEMGEEVFQEPVQLRLSKERNEKVFYTPE